MKTNLKRLEVLELGLSQQSYYWYQCHQSRDPAQPQFDPDVLSMAAMHASRLGQNASVLSDKQFYDLTGIDHNWPLPRLHGALQRFLKNLDIFEPELIETRPSWCLGFFLAEYLLAAKGKDQVVRQ